MQNFNETVSEIKILVKKMIAEQKEDHSDGVFAPFIIINNRDAKYYIYDKETFTDDFIKNELLAYDFVFLPHFILPRLKALKIIAIMLNVISFQEITGDQVDTYLEFVKQSTTFGVYSDNYDCHPYNDSDMQSVTNRL